MDELSVFSRVLSADDVQAIDNAGSAGKCKDVGMWVSGMNPILAICHNLTTGLSVVLELAEGDQPYPGIAAWPCPGSLRVTPGDWVHLEVVGTAN